MDLRSRSVNAKGGRGRGGAARTLKPNGVSKRNHINKVKQKRGNKRSVVARVGSAIQQISSEETPTTAVVEETPDFLPQEEDQLPEIDPNLVVFDQDFVYAHLSELNERTEPVLKLTELSLVCEQAVEKVQHLFGWPVAEVWEETWLVLLQDLFWAKFPGAKPIEATVCESVEEVLGTENKEKRQVHADLAEEGVGEIDWGDEERIDWGDE